MLGGLARREEMWRRRAKGDGVCVTEKGVVCGEFAEKGKNTKITGLVDILY